MIQSPFTTILLVSVVAYAIVEASMITITFLLVMAAVVEMLLLLAGHENSL